ncbi:hypothetical protein [Candidatus Trichorickettsia mobilis]|uniref:hypothetical protein n=1 Tax=Candidatus Trichorickettsia mobilis TaxID=1346319 RepID=UPI00292FF1DA|nr:hypothetical protein [Candidatus Trichorickettsia mobilis]
MDISIFTQLPACVINIEYLAKLADQWGIANFESIIDKLLTKNDFKLVENNVKYVISSLSSF